MARFFLRTHHSERQVVLRVWIWPSQKVGVVLFSLLISNDFHLSFVGVFWASGYIQLALTCLSQFPVLERSASFMKWSIFNLDSNRCDSNPSKANVECECLSCLHLPITSPFCNKFGRLNDIALNLGNESQWVSLSLSICHMIWMLKMFELMAMFRWVPLFFDPCLSHKGSKLSWWDVSVRFSSQRMRVMMRMSTTRVLRRAVATKLVVTVAIFFIRLRTFGLCWNCSVSLRYGW